MNGAGNAFLLVDARGAPRNHPDAARLRRWAVEHGYDQFLLLEDCPTADAHMLIWNADGERVGACGNGARAAAAAMMVAAQRPNVLLQTDSGPIAASAAAGGQVSVDLGPPRLDWSEIPLAREMDTVELDFIAEANGVRVERPGAVSMGNPHAVFFVHDVENLPIEALGREIEYDPLFPERVNAGFAQIYDPTHIRLRVWERGAGLTLACGTGACAAVVAARRRGLAERQCSVMTDGGELYIDWREDDHVVLTGAVEDEGAVELE